MSDIPDTVTEHIDHATNTVSEHVNAGTESLQEGTSHLVKAVEDTLTIVNDLAKHTATMAEYMIHMKPVESVKEVPEAAIDAVDDVKEPATETLEGASDIVASPAKVVVRKKKKFGRR